MAAEPDAYTLACVQQMTRQYRESVLVHVANQCRAPHKPWHDKDVDAMLATAQAAMDQQLRLFQRGMQLRADAAARSATKARVRHE